MFMLAGALRLWVAGALIAPVLLTAPALSIPARAQTARPAALFRDARADLERIKELNRSQFAALPLLSPLFTDNMVLQRGRPVNVWGWAAPGQTVTVSIDGKTATGKAGNDAKWKATLPPLTVGGPYTLKLTGPQTRTLNNILVGDVWVCSGQSNMEMGIGNVNNAEQEIASANNPQLRLFTVQKTIATDARDMVTGQWDVCAPQTVRAGGWNGFSAVAYFFGRELQARLHVPIGLIHTSWGGTPAEAWTSAEALQTMPDYRAAVEQLIAGRREAAQGEHSMAEKMAAWYTKNDPGTPGKWDGDGFNDADWQTMNLPGLWEQAGIPALSQFDGVVWYRRDFDLPADVGNKPCVLHLGPIDDRDTTWINGTPLGGMDEYNADRAYPIPANLLRKGRNSIAVRVLDTGGGGGIYGKPEQMFVEIPGEANIPLTGAWKYKIGVPIGQASPVPMMFANNPNVPTVLYNGMIAPLVPYGIKGAIWYQGESNAGKAYQYRTLLPTMIKDWRTRWQEGDFPFYIVQLANFQQSSAMPAEDAWAELREAQSLTARNIPNAGLAVTIDIGDAADIHPKNKQDVGKRLALAALAKTYGQKIEYSGPEYKAMKVEGDKIRLAFAHVGGGLLAKDGGKLTGFAIAGEDRKFQWADARIEGDSIVVSSPTVAHPVAVRYAWHINPVCNLVNKAGLPASPFRTDTWPGMTVNNK